MTLAGKRLAFIGGGTMAEAMVRGLLDRHLVPPSHVLVTGPRRGRSTGRDDPVALALRQPHRLLEPLET